MCGSVGVSSNSGEFRSEENKRRAFSELLGNAQILQPPLPTRMEGRLCRDPDSAISARGLPVGPPLPEAVVSQSICWQISAAGSK